MFNKSLLNIKRGIIRYLEKERRNSKMVEPAKKAGRSNAYATTGGKSYHMSETKPKHVRGKNV